MHLSLGERLGHSIYINIDGRHHRISINAYSTHKSFDICQTLSLSIRNSVRNI